MCKEDIRIARKAVTRGCVNDTGKTAAYKVLPANPNRYSLLGGMVATTIVDANKVPMLAAKIMGLYFPLVIGSSIGANDIVDIRKAGQAITGEIWFVPADASNTYSVYCGETELEQVLEQV